MYRIFRNNSWYWKTISFIYSLRYDDGFYLLILFFSRFFGKKKFTFDRIRLHSKNYFSVEFLVNLTEMQGKSVPWFFVRDDELSSKFLKNKRNCFLNTFDFITWSRIHLIFEWLGWWFLQSNDDGVSEIDKWFHKFNARLIIDMIS